ncbi:MAG TPA: hypothetical protein PKO07_06640 [Pseudomonadota bacterium]|nr:hypothetical protein [Pseudomonadota bacterium]HNN50682.1 hypothetical protein [Pseudomonadota bacterium]
MRLSTFASALLLFSSLALSACAVDREVSDDPAANGVKPGPGPGPGPGPIPNPSTGKLTGKVVAPEGTIPISGALVYVVPYAPTAIPDAVYCDKCVHIPDGTPHTTTKPDGTFELDASTGNYYLVVQKGAFRRVRQISIVEGAQQIPKDKTTLPAITDKMNGDDIPKIAVVVGAWDPIEVVLARMGLKATISKDLLGKAQVLAKDAPAFAIYGLQGLGLPSPYPSVNTLLTDPKELGKYHILFLPCSGGTNQMDTGPKCTGVFNTDARVKSNLADFVAKGGRIYVSDWSYEYVRQVFPGYITWRGESTQIGSACSGGGGNQSVYKKESGLDAWLQAQGKSLSEVKDAWTAIASVQDKMDIDADGKMSKITPKVWVETTSPVTASVQHGCGRVLYTTYHTQPTSETSGALEPQALALLYLILEVGVCIDPLVIG